MSQELRQHAAVIYMNVAIYPIDNNSHIDPSPVEIMDEKAIVIKGFSVEKTKKKTEEFFGELVNVAGKIK